MFKNKFAIVGATLAIIITVVIAITGLIVVAQSGFLGGGPATKVTEQIVETQTGEKEFAPTPGFEYYATPPPPRMLTPVYFNDTSRDIDGYIVSREWDFNQDEIIDETIEKPEWTFDVGGSHPVKLIVEDNDGNRRSIIKDVVILDRCGDGHCDNGDISNPNPILGYAIDLGENHGNCPEDCFVGNGVIDPGEECDDGNWNNNDGCSEYAIVEYCGDTIFHNGVWDTSNHTAANCNNSDAYKLCWPGCNSKPCGPHASEDCDDDFLNVKNNEDHCRNDCKWNICNDTFRCDKTGTISGVEDDPSCLTHQVCDDGNNANCDGCKGNCARADNVCGDYVQECGENCDQPTQTCYMGGTYNYKGTQSCNSGCKTGLDVCKTTRTCGDGHVDDGSEGNEVCEIGNTRTCYMGGTYNYKGTQTCKNDCLGWNACTTTRTCGDGHVDDGDEGNEVCDDSNTNNCDGCKGDCTRYDAVCGDGINECSEVCDDGNSNNNDDCVNCNNPVCGDGYTWTTNCQSWECEDCDPPTAAPSSKQCSDNCRSCGGESDLYCCKDDTCNAGLQCIMNDCFNCGGHNEYMCPEGDPCEPNHWNDGTWCYNCAFCNPSKSAGWHKCNAAGTGCIQYGDYCYTPNDCGGWPCGCGWFDGECVHLEGCFAPGANPDAPYQILTVPSGCWYGGFCSVTCISEDSRCATEWGGTDYYCC